MNKVKCSCGVELYNNRWQDHYKTHPECRIRNDELKKRREIEESPFVCEWCDSRFKGEKYLIRHQINDCKNIPSDKIPLSGREKIEKYNKETGIQCKECGSYQKELGYHLTQQHHMSIEDYCAKYHLTKDDLKSSLSKQKRHKANSVNGKKGNEKIQEMLLDPEYKKERGQKISQGILSSEHAIETRKKILTNLNKSEEFRSKSSSTMKKTWSENTDMSSFSHQWQIEDPEKLKNVIKICTSAPKVEVFKSKSEKEIRRWLKEDLGYQLDSGRFFIDNHYRFFDIRIEDLLIEIDGPWHFEEFYYMSDGSDRFKNCENSKNEEIFSIDRAKEKFAIENGYYLLRVSNWGDKLEDQKNIILEFLKNKHSLNKGIYKRGVKYED